MNVEYKGNKYRRREGVITGGNEEEKQRYEGWEKKIETGNGK